MLDIRDVVGMDALRQKLSAGPNEFVGSVAEDGFDVAADVDETPIRIGRPNDVRDVRDQRAIFFFAAAQRLLGTLTESDILDHRLELGSGALLPKKASHCILVPLNLAVGRDHPVIKRYHRLLRGQRGEVA